MQPSWKPIWETESGRQCAMVLRLENVVAGYDEGGDVLKGVNLEVEKNSITCIIGPNGAGKSTVLRSISGLLKPRIGSITFQDRAIAGMKPRQILALGIVQVPQNHSLFNDMTVRENIRLGGYLLRDSSLVARRLQELEELFPLIKERANDRAGDLSGGQQRTVEIARGLMLDPALVLLDEPSLGLAPKVLKQVLATATQLREMGKTVLLVEQNARSALHISTHGVVMESGRVRLTGSSQEILHNPEIGHLYLGGSLSSHTSQDDATNSVELPVRTSDTQEMP
ncbi:ABC transporter ATP-binding protein [Reticulibacter mediterranei]|uniref:ABC transporter ATP-binding protein n=2 Tax=Reticulibacter mediterranei TaxID=2778369 RepID=A0A8J3IH24_9CHLR|nr:ABC transporter ATP-binding protein [Reticulibacter mediterranei]